MWWWWYLVHSVRYFFPLRYEICGLPSYHNSWLHVMIQCIGTNIRRTCTRPNNKHQNNIIQRERSKKPSIRNITKHPLFSSVCVCKKHNWRCKLTKCYPFCPSQIMQTVRQLIKATVWAFYRKKKKLSITNALSSWFLFILKHNFK